MKKPTRTFLFLAAMVFVVSATAWGLYENQKSQRRVELMIIKEIESLASRPVIVDDSNQIDEWGTRIACKITTEQSSLRFLSYLELDVTKRVTRVEFRCAENAEIAFKLGRFSKLETVVIRPYQDCRVSAELETSINLFLMTREDVDLERIESVGSESSLSNSSLWLTQS